MDNNEQNQKAWQMLEKLATASAVEQRRSRRWGIFFKLLTFVYLFIALSIIFGGDGFSNKAVSATSEHTAVVRIQGPIMDEQLASAGNIIESLNEAFESEHSKAIVLAINSPGGSPVHAGYVYDEVNRLQEKHPEKKVYAVISDLGASAAYYIASAADEIYADKASLVGSIGVISASFGFSGAMEKLGVERRVITAGKNKAFLDPYQPLKPDEKAFWEDSLAVVHRQFIEQVQKGRGDKLADDPKIFTGLIWTGEQALDKGLVDGLGSVRYVARDVVGAKELVDYSTSPHPLDKFMREFGLTAAKAFVSELKVLAALPSLH